MNEAHVDTSRRIRFDCESESESESFAMGPCMSVCESTPDVPKNIIADPEVRPTRARASRTVILNDDGIADERKTDE